MARFTRRISAIFSSMEAVFCSIFRRRSRVPHSNCRDCRIIWGVVGFCSVSTPEGETRAVMSG